MKYRTIVADPPWKYDLDGLGRRPSLTHRPNRDEGLGRFGAGSEGRYGAMTADELMALEVAESVEEPAHLYLWTTNAFICEAHDIARSWGFTPKTVCTWGKVKDDGSPSMKTGRWFRGATEHVVFGTRGRFPFEPSEPIPTLWLWPRLPHSVKPDAFYDIVERLSPPPYLELFARRQRLGWDTWGNEALTHVQLGEASA